MRKELEIENEIEQLILVEQFIDEVGESFQLGQIMIQNLNLVLEETVSNVIFYAYPDEIGRKIHLIITQQENGIEIILRDSGLPFDPTARPDPDIELIPEKREVGGLGIYLVRQLMDEVIYQREGEENVLVMRMLY